MIRPELQQLIDQDVISVEQAEAVSAALRGEAAAQPPTVGGDPRGEAAAQPPTVGGDPRGERDGGRWPSPVMEALGYVGAALVTVSALTLGSELWDQLPTPAHVMLLGLVAAALWIGARWIAGNNAPAARRLTGALVLLSAVAAGATAVVAAAELANLENDVTALVAGATLLAHGVVSWIVHQGPVPHITAAAGVVTVIVAGADTLGVPSQVTSAVVWATGAGWAMINLAGAVPHRRTGYVVSALAMGGAAQALAFALATPGAGLALGLVTTILLFAAAALRSELVPAGFGIAGTAVFLPQALNEWFGDTIGAPLVLLITGAALVATSLVALRTAKPGSA